MRVVFMGTPDAAVPALRAAADAFDVVAAYTRPDKARGRGLHVDPSPVKKFASERGIEIVQPKNLRNEAPRLAEFAPDFVLVVAYGAILPPDVLAVPRSACVNVHFSLLPRWRGAAPVERAILAGDDATGVTTMLMDEGLDTGPMLLRHTERINPDDTAGALRERLANVGADLAVRTLEGVSDGSVTARPQPDSGVTYADKIGADEAKLDLSATPEENERKVRAFDPSPGAYVMFRGKRLKVWRAAVDGDELRLLEVQPEGKRRMSGEEFERGYRPVRSDFA